MKKPRGKASDKRCQVEEQAVAPIKNGRKKTLTKLASAILTIKHLAGVAAPASLLAQGARGCNEIYHLKCFSVILYYYFIRIAHFCKAPFCGASSFQGAFG